MNKIYTLNELTYYDDGTVMEEVLIASKDASKLKEYADREFPLVPCVTKLTASYILCDNKQSHLLITTLPLL